MRKAITQRYLLKLDAQDEALLENLKVYLREGHTAILRWALRLFAAIGEWPTTERERVAVLSFLDGPLDVGPRRRRIDECQQNGDNGKRKLKRPRRPSRKG